MNMVRGSYVNIEAKQRNWVIRLITWGAVVAIGLLLWADSPDVLADATKGKWFQVTLETGETEEFKWAVGAKGPGHEPLGRICALASLVEPPQENQPFVEGNDAVGCGSLSTSKDSVAASPAFGSGDSRLAILATLFRPAVRKVSFVLDTGEERVLRTRMGKIPNRSARGVPRFRYLTVPFKGPACIRKVTLFDGNDRVIFREARPPCPDGGNV